MEAGRPYVFVQTGGERFARRFVEIAARDGDWIGVKSGVKPGERVVDARRLRRAAGLGGERTARRRARALRNRHETTHSMVDRPSLDGDRDVGPAVCRRCCGRRGDMPVDVFPDLTAPTVTILDRRSRHGARTRWNRWSRSRSRAPSTAPPASGASDRRRRVGIAVVWVEFDWGTDIFAARQIVAEKLALVGGTLPPQVERPVLAPISSIMGEILFFAISSDDRRSAGPADGRRHGRPAAAAGDCRRVAGHADRRRRAAVPGHRAPRSAAREQRRR